jgi:SAM-dependent methyltransferase
MNGQSPKGLECECEVESTSSMMDFLLSRSSVYRLWQAPFADAKLAPVLADTDFLQAHRVLDVGCGPGTNTRHFQRAEYLGLDLNPRYIEFARRHYGGEFVVADATKNQIPGSERFDLILINSLLHHVDDNGVLAVLESAARLLSDQGYAYILDLVLPEEASIARKLALCDRGAYPRSLDHWRLLFERCLIPVKFETYCITFLGIVLWKMIYLKARRRP